MEKNFSLYYINKYYIKLFISLYKQNKLLGRNQIFFKKNYFFFNKLKSNNLFIYKGNKFRTIQVLYFHSGYRFGSFIFTRKPFKYLIKTKNSGKFIKR